MDQDGTRAHRHLERAKNLLDREDAAAAAPLLAEVTPELRADPASAHLLRRVLKMRLACMRKMLDASGPVDEIWEGLEQIDTDDAPDLAGDLAALRLRCAQRAANNLDANRPISEAGWREIVIWRRHITELAPELKQNWRMLGTALVRSGRPEEALALLHHPDAEIAALLEETIGLLPELVRLMLRPDGSLAAPPTARPAPVGVRRALVAARLLLGDQRAPEAARLLDHAQDAASGLDDAELLARVRLLRVTCASQMPVEMPAEDVWAMLQAIDVADAPEAARARLAALTFCAMREVDRLELGRSVLGVDWGRIVAWRERIAALGPERKHNWNRLAMALIQMGRVAEAKVILAPADPVIAAFLAETVGQAADVLPALRRSTAYLYRQEAPRYLERGLPVVPCLGQNAVYPGWERYAEQMPDLAEVAAWTAVPWAQIGLVLGPCSGIGILNVSTWDADMAARIIQAVPPTPWRRTGHDAVLLAFRRGPAAAARREANGWLAFDYSDDRALHLLPPSTQIFDGTPYTSTCHLADVLDSLPTLPENFADLLDAVLS